MVSELGLTEGLMFEFSSIYICVRYEFKFYHEKMCMMDIFHHHYLRLIIIH